MTPSISKAAILAFVVAVQLVSFTEPAIYAYSKAVQKTLTELDLKAVTDCLWSLIDTQFDRNLC